MIVILVVVVVSPVSSSVIYYYSFRFLLLEAFRAAGPAVKILHFYHPRRETTSTTATLYNFVTWSQQHKVITNSRT